jgi:hypothetical protein
MTFAFLSSHFNGAGLVYFGAKNRLLRLIQLLFQNKATTVPEIGL